MPLRAFDAAAIHTLLRDFAYAPHMFTIRHALIQTQADAAALLRSMMPPRHHNMMFADTLHVTRAKARAMI